MNPVSLYHAHKPLDTAGATGAEAIVVCDVVKAVLESGALPGQGCRSLR